MKINYPKQFLINLYRSMVRIREAEEILVEPIISGEIKCPCHLCSGQEAVATGVCMTLAKGDYIFGNHRSHGHYLAKGGDLTGMFAEIYGRDAGCAGGRGGSMHLVSSDNGVLGVAPIVGGTISLALGVALASKIRKDKRVTVSFFGDGATGEGVLYESMNFAALKKLPIIFVCENNLYSTHLSIDECRPNREIFKVAVPFGIDSKRIDGNDVLKVYETVVTAIEGCRKGNGPKFIECLTYRLRGHVGPDDNIQGTRIDIRPPQEIKRWKKKDPIKKFEKFLLTNGFFNEKALELIKREVVSEVNGAYMLAKGRATPLATELTKYVYKQ